MALLNHLFGAFIVTICCCYLISAEEVKYQLCPPKSNVTYACDIKTVRIDPCKEAPNKPCRIKRGTNARISIDFVPKFNSEKLMNKAFWVTGVMDLEFIGMNSNACDFTTCPLVAGQEQTYAYSLEISKKYPLNKYSVKWRLMAEEGKECCFIIDIKLIR